MPRKEDLNSSLQDFVRDSVRKGHSTKDIRKAMLKHGFYSSKIDGALSGIKDKIDHNLARIFNDEAAKRNLLVVLMLMVSLISVNLLYGSEPAHATGFVVEETAAESQELTIQNIEELPSSSAVINTPPVWISDTDTFNVEGSMTLNISKLFMDKDGDKLVFDVQSFSNMDIVTQGDMITFIPNRGYSGAITLLIGADDGTDKVEKELAFTVGGKVNAKVLDEPKKITLALQYGSTTGYDYDNDGTETIDGVVDLTAAGTIFNWDVNQANLCTRWEVYNDDEESITTSCNGNSACCSFVGLAPSKDKWDGLYYLTLGKDGAGRDNIVSSQVIYYDVNLDIDNLKSDVHHSEWESLDVKFK